jgi:superfamily I DNA/RNA helicase
MAKSFFIEESELDTFQIQLIHRTIHNSMVISGCAGSGKSIIALWKAKRIQEECGNNYTFIVYTKALNQYMKDGMEAIGLAAENFTYHWQWKKAPIPREYIIVDEIQDFTQDEIKQFKDNTKKTFFFFGDTAQSIYRQYRETLSVQEIAYQAKIELMRLYFNYRLPKPIAKITEDYIGVHTKYDEVIYKSNSNERPKILMYNSINEQLDKIIEIIRNRKFTDVGILLPDNNAVRKTYDYLRSKLNVEVKYEDKSNWKNSRMDISFNSTNPKLMTYHSAKGLQFEAVFLPDCNIEGSDDARSALYVAMTRSYQSLYIIYSGRLSPFFDAVPQSLYDTSLNVMNQIEEI